MSDLKGIGIWLLGVFAKLVFFLPAIIQGIRISHKKKNVGDYFYSLGSGIDLFGAKLIAPHANKYWVKEGGRLYGKHEHISTTMAINKRYGYNTKYADRWERFINFFDTNHLDKIEI